MLYSKYRPKNFTEVVGQRHIIKSLSYYLSHKDTSFTASIFSGAWGSGKTTLAKIYAKAFLCDNSSEEGPCNTCDSCKFFADERHPAFMEIDGASRGKVEDIKNLLSLQKPIGYTKRIIIIDECHRVTKEAWNLFLKEIEDASNSNIYLFCTTEMDKVLDTIKSRCILYNLKPLQFREVLKYTKKVCVRENISYEDKALKKLVSFCKGHLRDVLKYITQMNIMYGGLFYNSTMEFLQEDSFSVLQDLLLLEDKKEVIKRIPSITEKYSNDALYRSLKKCFMNWFESGFPSKFDTQGFLTALLYVSKVSIKRSSLDFVLDFYVIREYLYPMKEVIPEEESEKEKEEEEEAPKDSEEKIKIKNLFNKV